VRGNTIKKELNEQKIYEKKHRQRIPTNEEAKEPGEKRKTQGASIVKIQGKEPNSEKKKKKKKKSPGPPEHASCRKKDFPRQ